MANPPPNNAPPRQSDSGPRPVPASGTAGPDSTSLRNDYVVLQSLYEFMRDIGTSSLALDEVLQHAVRSVVNTLHVTHATVFLYDQGRGSGKVVSEYPDMGSVGTVIERQGNPTLLRMENDPSTVIVPDIDTAQDILGATQAIAKQLGIRSMLLVPIRSSSELIGALSVDVYTERRDFSPSEVQSLEAVAVQLSANIRNAQLFEQVNRRAAANERIIALGRQLLASLDRDAIFRAAAEAAHDLLPADGVSAALRDSEDRHLYVYLLSDAEARRPLNAPLISEIAYEESALRFICNSGETLNLHDISQSVYPDYQVLVHNAPTDRWTTGEPMRSIIATPLRVAGHIIGTFHVTAEERRAFDTQDSAIVEQIANQLALALENSRLFRQASERAQIEQLMAQLGASAAHIDLQTLVLNTMREIGTIIGARTARVRLQMPSTEGPALRDMEKLRKLLDSRSGLSAAGTDGRDTKDAKDAKDAKDTKDTKAKQEAS